MLTRVRVRRLKLELLSNNILSLPPIQPRSVQDNWTAHRSAHTRSAYEFNAFMRCGYQQNQNVFDLRSRAAAQL